MKKILLALLLILAVSVFNTQSIYRGPEMKFSNSYSTAGYGDCILVTNGSYICKSDIEIRKVDELIDNFETLTKDFQNQNKTIKKLTDGFQEQKRTIEGMERTIKELQRTVDALERKIK